MYKIHVKFIIGLCLCLIISGCGLSLNQSMHDRAANMEVQDYREALRSRMPDENKENSDVSEGIAFSNDVPKFQPYVVAPSDNLKPMPLVSVSVNQTVPLRDVLYDLANQADYDIELDSRITGAVILTARNKPLDVVVDKIARMAGLRYKFEDESLRVELDTPYIKNYKIDYLNYIRSSSSSVTNDISVVSGDGADSGSTFTAEAESESDFWGELEANMQQILAAARNDILSTTNDPTIRVVPAAPTPVGGEGTGAGEMGDIPIESLDPNSPPPPAVLEIASLPPVEGSQGNSSSFGEEDEGFATGFSINRQAGIVSVLANEKKHKEVKEYMRELKRSVTAQVLIEAKILEVQLNDEYSTGINWANLDVTGKATLNVNFARPPLNPTVTPAGSIFQASINSSDVGAVVQAISRFGTVRALSSPRLTVLNNQSAVLNVAQNLVYFELEVESTDTTATSAGGNTVESEIRNVPEGVIINVQPSIDLEDRTVSMALRPTITNVETFVSDPGAAIAIATLGLPAGTNVQSLIPVVQVQEFDSVIQVRSGEAVVMGGLMQDRTNSDSQGVPIISEIPVIGNAFKARNDKISKLELVILLKATILDPYSSIHETDKELYKLYSGDRRPLDM